MPLCLCIPCIRSHTHHFLTWIAIVASWHFPFSVFTLFLIFLPHCRKNGLFKHNTSRVKISQWPFVVFMTNSKLLSLAYKFYYHLILTYFCSFLNLPALIHVWFLLHKTFNLFLGINVLLPRMPWLLSFLYLTHTCPSGLLN